MLEFKRALGVTVREARLAMGMSQDDVAGDMGCTRQAVGSWEAGRTTPSLREFRDLVLLLGLSADEVLQVVSASTICQGVMALRPPQRPQFIDSQL